MRTRVLFALVLVAALPVIVNAQATTPCGSAPMTAVPATPTYMSGTLIGGPMYAASPMYGNYTVVERTGPFGFMRWRTVEPAPTVMPPPAMTASAVVPAAATTPMPATGVVTGGYLTSPMPAEPYTVVERRGPLGLMRWRTVEPATTVMPAPMMPTSAPGVMPTAATTPMPATTTTGVVAGNYVVPPASTPTVVPATYTYTWTGPLGRRYYSAPMYMDGATYYTAPGSVMPATYATPAYTGTYTYPAYSTGRYFNFMGFGFGWR
jgi:hypothetical protein